MDEAELHQPVKDELKEVVDEEQVPLTSLERQRLTREIIDDVLGHGPIQRFLDDPAVTEVMVNRYDSIYVERARPTPKDGCQVQLGRSAAPGHRTDRVTA